MHDTFGFLEQELSHHIIELSYNSGLLLNFDLFNNSKIKALFKLETFTKSLLFSMLCINIVDLDSDIYNI